MNLMPNADHAMPMVATKDVGNVAADVLLAKPTKSEVIDISGPAYSNRQVAQILGALLGKSIKIVDVPESNWVQTMQQGGLSKTLSEAFAEMYKGFGSGAIVPKGDRTVQGTTALEETLKYAVAAAEMNPVGWFEIPTRDLNKSSAFYEAVLGVKLAPNNMGPMKMAWFPMNAAAAGAPGSLVQADGYEPSNRGSMVYLSVSDIEKTLAKVTEKGGRVLAPKHSIGEHGFVAEILDLEGNRVAIHSKN
jgi:predicted enzyme related to lactoylglutathione lyase